MDSEQKKRIKSLRNKVKRGSANAAEQEELRQWDSQKRRGRPPKYTVQPPTASSMAMETPISTISEVGSDIPISVQSSLPGSGQEEPNLPPLNVDPNIATGETASSATNTGAQGAATGATSSSTTTNPTPGHSASNASTNGSAPKVSPAEAAANAKEISGMVTGALITLNNWTVNNGGMGMPPAYFAQFDVSFARLLAKYGGNVDQEDVDSVVVVGGSAFIGYNALQTHRRLKKEGKDKNSVERHPPPAPAADPKQGPPPPVVPIRANGAFLPPNREPSVGEIINPNGNRVY